MNGIAVDLVGPAMLLKYPRAGEQYESLLYAGERCRVLSVMDAEVTFEWVGRFAHIEPQKVKVARFVRDFSLADSEPA
jgi:hypothetical protein